MKTSVATSFNPVYKRKTHVYLQLYFQSLGPIVLSTKIFLVRKKKHTFFFNKIGIFGLRFMLFFKFYFILFFVCLFLFQWGNVGDSLKISKLCLLPSHFTQIVSNVLFATPRSHPNLFPIVTQNLAKRKQKINERGLLTPY